MAEQAKRIDIGWLVRQRLLWPGETGCGTLSWNQGGQPAGWISFSFNMTDPDNADLTLSFTVTSPDHPDGKSHIQRVPISYTVPNFGGRRWWMHCPLTGQRVGTLYCPANGSLFASRGAHGIAYRSQRQGADQRPFDALVRLQRQLGCEEGWEQFIYRPKGMWHRTFARLERRYHELDAECAVIMASHMMRLAAG